MPAAFKHHTGYLVSQLRALIRGRIDDALADKALTAPQYVALATLEEEPCLSNAEMARLCFVTPQTMLRIIQNLDDAGLVTRSPHPTHGRVRQIELTPKGRKLIGDCHRRVLKLEERLIADLTAAERRQLFALLQKCVASLSRSEA